MTFLGQDLHYSNTHIYQLTSSEMHVVYAYHSGLKMKWLMEFILAHYDCGLLFSQDEMVNGAYISPL